MGRLVTMVALFLDDNKTNDDGNSKENGKQTMVVYHLQEFSGKSGSKVNGTRLFGSSQRKISGSNGTSEKVVLFFRMKYS